MDDIFSLIYKITPLIVIICGVIGYLIRVQMGRIDMLEQHMVRKVEEPQVRQIIADKIDPLKEDIQQVNNKLDTIYNILIHKE